jgi:hypothetical protein
VSNNEYQKFVQCKAFALGIFMAPTDNSLPWGAIITGVAKAEGNTFKTVYETQWRDRMVVLYRFPSHNFADVIPEGASSTKFHVPAYLVAIVKDEDNRVYMVDDSLTDKVSASLKKDAIDSESDDLGDIVAIALAISGGRWDLPLLSIWTNR